MSNGSLLKQNLLNVVMKIICSAYSDIAVSAKTQTGHAVLRLSFIRLSKSVFGTWGFISLSVYILIELSKVYTDLNLAIWFWDHYHAWTPSSWVYLVWK